MGWIDLDITGHDRSWMAKAKCRGMDTSKRNEIFFPDKGGSTKLAKIFCTGLDPRTKEPIGDPCPVINQCLEYALLLPQSETLGVWAGTTVSDRRFMKYQREPQDL